MARAQSDRARSGARTMPRWLRAAMCLVLVLAWVKRSSAHRGRTVVVHGYPMRLQENFAIRVPFDDECRFYKGKVINEDDSAVAITECDGRLYGLLRVRGKEVVLEPTKSSRHVLRRRDVGGVALMDEPPAFNLTGDTVTDLDLHFDKDDEDDDIQLSYIGPKAEHNNVEYFHSKSPVYTRPVSGVQGLWLEIAIVADNTVTKFHGKERVDHYILALMNIVSQIFNDSSLDSNMTLVINKLFLTERDTILKNTSVHKKLEAVNKWNFKHLDRLPAGHRGWDVTVWLTRTPLGGPSGFAAVDGVCIPRKSTALIHDEGLTSAFVIAHELGHLLGLTHDGVGQCKDEPGRGFVMATTVYSTIQKYSWSTCSKKQFHEKSKNWWCMHERSDEKGIILGDAKELAKYVFTMDEQCRTEFGDGYIVCELRHRSPCARLWCAHSSEPQVCRSKRSPPLQGTPCGGHHWCVDHICEPMPDNVAISGEKGDRRDSHRPPRWSSWGPWSECDVDCGYGLRIRSRQCRTGDSTSEDCEGLATQPETCWSGRKCTTHRDMRAFLCHRHSITSIPYWPDSEKKHCEIWCVDYKGGDSVPLGSLPDGTPCSYERPYDLCYQGVCLKGHCHEADPVCNFCYDGYCNNNTNLYYPKLRNSGWVRLGVVPHDAYNLSIRITSPTILKIGLREKGKSKIVIDLTKHFQKQFELQQLLENTIDYKPYYIPQNLQILEIDSDIIRKNEEQNYGYEGQTVASGVVLEWKQLPNEITITSKSPVQADLMILGGRRYFDGEFEDSVALEVSVNYSTPAWRTGPSEYRSIRGPCSVSCGGGHRRIKTRCPAGRRCPSVTYEMCNTHRCEFEWAPAEWEECSQTCGEGGVQERQIFCVPTDARSSTSRRDLIVASVSPALCSSTRPPSNQPCNRMQCPVYWQELDWTPCSTTCGRGITRKPLICPAKDSSLCGPRPQEKEKRCRLRRCPSPRIPSCRKPDATQYCEFFPAEQLLRYCTRRSFRDHCCYSCRAVDYLRTKHG